MASNQATPDTIVLIHGLWLTPLSWEHWVDRYTKRGYKVVAPTWPGMEGGIEDLRRNPDKVAGLGVTEIVDHYDAIVRGLDPGSGVLSRNYEALCDRFIGLGYDAVAHDKPRRLHLVPGEWPTVRALLTTGESSHAARA